MSVGTLKKHNKMASNISYSNGHGLDGSSTELFSDASVDELDNIRLREITSKAVSGTLLLLVKWFKRSRKSTPRVQFIHGY